MKKWLPLIITGLFWIQNSYAQNHIDVLRYSQTEITGTPRFSGMAGAFTALGGDFSSLNLNPAGTGVYRSDEFSASLSIFNNNNETTYLNNTNDEGILNLNFSNLGLVKTVYTDNPDWNRVNFAFGVNRKQNFHNEYRLSGTNNNSSFTSSYVNSAQGLSIDQLDNTVFSAFQTYVIDTTSAGNYISSINTPGQNQSLSVTESGSNNEFFISLGTGYKEKLFLGVTFGFSSIYYKRTADYIESEIQNDTDVTIEGSETQLDRYRQRQTTVVVGAGFNMKVGVIYRPVKWLRFGSSYHSPNYYRLEEDYSIEFSSVFRDGQRFNYYLPGFFDYSINSPMRFNNGVAILFGKKGLLSVDYEIVDYSQGELKTDVFYQSIEDSNDLIKDIYQSTGNLRIGTEWRLNAYSLRAGYAKFGNAFANDLNDNSQTSYTFGAGYRHNQISMDVAFIHSESNEDLYIYEGAESSVNSHITNNFIMGVTYRF